MSEKLDELKDLLLDVSDKLDDLSKYVSSIDCKIDENNMIEYRSIWV